MSKMTHDRWMAIWKTSWAKARREHPTTDLQELHTRLWRAMEKRYGPCPKAEVPKPSLLWRIGIRIFQGKLKGRLEERMNGKASKLPKWALGLIWGLGSAVTTFQTVAGGGVTAEEWAGVAGVFLTTFVAKYSNPEKLISPKPSVK